jgi:hypothetical protein
MMKTLAHIALFSIAFLFAFAPVTSYAGPGDSCHFHGSKPAAESTILKCANTRKESLVKSGKLEKSWGPLNHESIAYVDGKKGKEWKVSFVNPEASDKAKTNLFMFFTPPGNFIAANHTGQ